MIHLEGWVERWIHSNVSFAYLLLCTIARLSHLLRPRYLATPHPQSHLAGSPRKRWVSAKGIFLLSSVTSSCPLVPFLLLSRTHAPHQPPFRPIILSCSFALRSSGSHLSQCYPTYILRPSFPPSLSSSLSSNPAHRLSKRSPLRSPPPTPPTRLPPPWPRQNLLFDGPAEGGEERGGKHYERRAGGRARERKGGWADHVDWECIFFGGEYGRR